MQEAKTITVTMQMPEVEGYEYTGEFRRVKEGELFLDDHNNVCKWGVWVETGYKRPILRKKRWRAEVGEKYWSVEPSLQVVYSEDARCHFDNTCYEVGNYYRTEAEAEQAAERVRKAYLGGE